MIEKFKPFKVNPESTAYSVIYHAVLGLSQDGSVLYEYVRSLRSRDLERGERIAGTLTRLGETEYVVAVDMDQEASETIRRRQFKFDSFGLWMNIDGGSGSAEKDRQWLQKLMNERRTNV